MTRASIAARSRLDDAVLRLLAPDLPARRHSAGHDRASVLTTVLDHIVERPEEYSISEPRTHAAALAYTEAMREPARADLFDAVRSAEPALAPATWLWLLADELLRLSRCELAYGIFLTAAVKDLDDDLVRGALLVKAAEAAITGGQRGAGYVLRFARDLLARVEVRGDRSDAKSLVLMAANYHDARLQTTRDLYDSAETALAEARRLAASVDVTRLLNVNCDGSDVPDFALPTARLHRALCSASGDPTTPDALAVLDAAEAAASDCVLMNEPLFRHHIAYLRAAVLMATSRPDRKRCFDEADRALRLLEPALDLPTEPKQRADWPAEPVATQRYGFSHCLLAEIHMRLDNNFGAARGELIQAQAAWSRPQYLIGLSRAKRNEALCLWRLGGDSQRVSRLLTEALMDARAVGHRGDELRALSSKVHFHRAELRPERAGAYEAEVESLLPHHPEMKLILERLGSRWTSPVARESDDMPEAATRAGLIGRSPSFARTCRSALRYAQWGHPGLPIILVGETGTGKDLFADFIHRNSSRASKSFRQLQLTQSMDGSMIRSELIGHAKGAFTDAKDYRPGAFEQARGGTVFINELQDLIDQAQKALLEVLEQTTIIPLGGTVPISPDVRLIIGTRVPLGDLLKQRKLRSDLYHRLLGAEILLPALRDRRDDLNLLAQQLFASALKDLGVDRDLQLSEQLVNRLHQHDWPGNVRELRQVMRFIATVVHIEIRRGKDITNVTEELARPVLERLHHSPDQTHVIGNKMVRGSEFVGWLETSQSQGHDAKQFLSFVMQQTGYKNELDSLRHLIRSKPDLRDAFELFYPR